MEYIEKSFSYLVPSDFNMYYCGKRINTENHSYGPQVRNHFLLVYIKSGNAMLALRDNCIDLHSGQLLCMFPNEKSTIEFVIIACGATCGWVYTVQKQNYI